jgi:MYXO-CTERM domain-containing protein
MPSLRPTPCTSAVATTRSAIRCLSAVLLLLAAPAFADDVNCNGIPREQEKDALSPGNDCVHYQMNGNSCIRQLTAPTRKCDDYVAPGDGLAATCSPTLAIDSDGDGFGDSCDKCPSLSNPDQKDGDRDGIGDVCDNCPTVANFDQKDSLGNGVGDACRNCPSSALVGSDTDSDGRPDVCDNCVVAANPKQEDSDKDGVGDACDNCPAISNSDQKDSDKDGVGDICDNCFAAPNPDQLASPTGRLGRDGRPLGAACDAELRGCAASATPPTASGAAALIAMFALALAWLSRRSFVR